MQRYLTGFTAFVLFTLASPLLGDTQAARGLEGTLLAALGEPLMAWGGLPSDRESAALEATIEDYRASGGSGDLEAIDRYLARFPASPYRVSLLIQEGAIYRRAGRFTRALESWELAWDEAKRLEADQSPVAENRAGPVLAGEALGNLVELTAALGRADRLIALLEEADGRVIGGNSYDQVSNGRMALWSMEKFPDQAFRCGPIALAAVVRALDPEGEVDPRIEQYPSSSRGTSLAEMARLARSTGVELRTIRRKPGSPVPVPSILHWRIGHFAAITGQRGDHYVVEDPTSRTGEIWVSREVLDEEGSGYLLVPAADVARLPPGWRPAGRRETKRIWGRGVTGNPDPGATMPGQPKLPRPPDRCPPGRGLPHYDFHTAILSLNIEDIPLGYNPPIGPAIDFRITYNSREAYQPTSPVYANLGARWSYDWLAYVYDNPNFPGANVRLFERGGGSILFSGYTSTGPETGYYVRNHEGRHSYLERTGPNSYVRHFPDGTREIYAVADNLTIPRRVYLSSIVDRAGNAIELEYAIPGCGPGGGCFFRLETIRDPLGRETTLSFTPGDTYRIASVTDPFGRTATLEYNAQGYLSAITDVLGLRTTFEYTPGIPELPPDFISSMTTPYGTTRFEMGESGTTTRWLQATNPLGDTERIEFTHEPTNIPASDPPGAVPAGWLNNYLQYRNTFYWDRVAMQTYSPTDPNRYLDATVRMHWLHDRQGTGALAASILESSLRKDERRLWFKYPGQPATNIQGSISEPSVAARVLDDGTEQRHEFSYLSNGHLSTRTDPVGRELRFVWSADSLDLLEVRNESPGGPVESIASFSYVDHLPVTYTDAAGQVSHYAYNEVGQLASTTLPDGTIVNYVHDKTSRLLTEVNVAGTGFQVSFTYDPFDRVRTWTSTEGFTLTYDYDALDRVTKFTFPDGTTEEYSYDRLDMIRKTDRLGRVTEYGYDPIGRTLFELQVDTGRQTDYAWFPHGQLKQVTDANGNVTSWTINSQGQFATKTIAGGQVLSYTYDTAGRPLTRTDAIGQLTSYTYDKADHLTKINYSNTSYPTPSVAFTYDPRYPRLQQMSDAGGLTTYTYYPVGGLGGGRLWKVDGPLGADLITFGYDVRSTRNQSSINSVASTDTFDALSRIVQRVNPLGSFTNSYLDAGPRLATTTYPNGLTISRQYFGPDQDLRLQQLQAVQAPVTPISQYDYLYDNAGDQITSLTTTVGSGLPEQVAFTYDPDGELLLADRGVDLEHVFTYDPVGNRLTERLGHAPPITATFNQFNQLTHLEGGLSTPRDFTYDANGNMISDDARTLTWDAENRLRVIVDGTHRTNFFYDGRGRLIWIGEFESGNLIESRRLIWIGTQIAEERNGQGQTVRRYYPQGVEDTGQPFYYVRDHLDSVREVLDASGAVRASFEYDPFGRRTKTSGDVDVDIGFDNYFHHRPSELDLALYRNYDPDLGRWISRDPLDDAEWSQGMNLYHFAYNDPINRVDPLGDEVFIFGRNPTIIRPGPWRLPPSQGPRVCRPIRPTRTPVPRPVETPIPPPPPPRPLPWWWWLWQVIARGFSFGNDIDLITPPPVAPQPDPEGQSPPPESCTCPDPNGIWYV